jgi:hypothetical protein
MIKIALQKQRHNEKPDTTATTSDGTAATCTLTNVTGTALPRTSGSTIMMLCRGVRAGRGGDDV